MEVYEHKALIDATKQIRLLRFLSSSKSDKIVCSLREVWIDTKPSYAAISYTWGAPAQTRSIEIDGRRLCVTENCFYALTQLVRQQESPLTDIWMDGICINQKDLDEKSAQVRMMGEIYENAPGVFACVGQHSDDSRWMLAVLKSLLASIGASPRPLRPELNASGGYTSRCRVMMWFRDFLYRHWTHNCQDWRTTTFARYEDRFWNAFREFGSRRYWTRLWIVQELWLALDLNILCGDCAINIAAVRAIWEHVIDAAPFAHRGYRLRRENYMSHMLEPSKHMPSVPKGPRSYVAGPERKELTRTRALPPSWQRPRTQSNGSNADILYMMNLYSSWQCSDFRDRVYALQRLVAWPIGTRPLLPDYRCSGVELFSQLIRCLDPFIDRGLYLLAELKVLTPLLHIDPKSGAMQSLMQSRRSKESGGQHSIPTLRHKARILLTQGFDVVEDVWELQDVTTCHMYDSSDGSLCAHFDYDSTYFRPFVDERHKVMERLINDSCNGRPLYSGATQIGRLPLGARTTDLLLQLNQREECPLWLLLRGSTDGRTYHIVGIAVIRLDWYVPEQGRAARPSNHMYELFLAPEDLLCLYVCYEKSLYYKVDSLVGWVDECVELRLAADKYSSLAILREVVVREAINLDEHTVPHAPIEHFSPFECDRIGVDGAEKELSTQTSAGTS